MEDYLPESICRSCLQRSDDLTSLHSKDGDTGLTLLDKLRFCASMQVPVSERMPSNACAPCVRCITEYYDFKRRCEQSDKTLEKLCTPKHEAFLEVEEEGVTKTEPDDSNSSCDDVSDLTPILEEVDNPTIAPSMLDDIVPKHEAFLEVEEEGVTKTEPDDSNSSCDDVSDLTPILEEVDNPTIAPRMLNDIVLKHEAFLEVEEEGVTKTESYDSNLSCDDVSDLTPILEEVDNSTIARDDKGRSDVSFKCEICKKTFKMEHDLQKHVRRHLVRKRQCDGCKQVFDSLPKMLEHRASAHPDLDPYTVKDKIVLLGQLDDLKVKRNHPCNMCSCSYPSLKCLRKHKMLCHSAKHTEGTKYACKTCGKSNRSMYSLRVHIAEKHAAEKPIYTCKVCGKTYNLISSYNRHKGMHKWSDFLIKCDICGKSFRTKQEQEEHVCKRQCDGCNEVFNSLSEMLEHRASSHPDLDPYVDEGKNLTPGQLDDLKAVYKYQCDVCLLFYPTKEHLNRHKTRSHSEGQNVDDFNHVCEKCGKAFRARRSLREHVFDNHSTEKPAYECKECGKTYNNRGGLRAHRRKHKLEKQTLKASDAALKMRCDGCEEVFNSLSEMLEHRASAHPGLDPYVVEDKILTPNQVNDSKEKKYPCDECSRSFAKFNFLRSHKTLMHFVRRHQCEHCGIMFAKDNLLSRHLKRVHAPGGKIKYICATCGKEYSSKYSLRTHIEEKHAAEKPIYTCKVCGKTYNCKASIEAHSVTHEPPNYCFRCDRCDSAFLSRTRLVRHVKHTHNKPYSCDMCNKRFAIEVKLLKHKATHVRDMAKPYACTLCKKRFSKTSAVAIHMSKLH